MAAAIVVTLFVFALVVVCQAERRAVTREHWKSEKIWRDVYDALAFIGTWLLCICVPWGSAPEYPPVNEEANQIWIACVWLGAAGVVLGWIPARALANARAPLVAGKKVTEESAYGEATSGYSPRPDRPCNSIIDCTDNSTDPY